MVANIEHLQENRATGMNKRVMTAVFAVGWRWWDGWRGALWAEPVGAGYEVGDWRGIRARSVRTDAVPRRHHLGRSSETQRRWVESIAAMLKASLALRGAVPSTSQLMHVAAGRMDAFWQFSQVRSGVVAGAQLVDEAGGLVSDAQGRPWTLRSDNLVDAAPGVRTASVDVLRPIL